MSILLYYPKKTNSSFWGESRYITPRDTIKMEKEGKYLYLYKESEKDIKYYRYDLATHSFERVNIYKTVDNKYTPIKVENLRKWFVNCKIVTDDEIFARVFIYNKTNRRYCKYKNPVRYIDLIDSETSMAIEEWYRLGVKIKEVEKVYHSACLNDYADGMTHSRQIPYRPMGFLKQIQLYIRNGGEVDIDTLRTLRYMEETDVLILQKMKDIAKIPQYFDVWNIEIYGDESSILDNDGSYRVKSARTDLLDVIKEFNLDIEALARFLDRIRRVEGCDVSDLTDGYHYRDYLRQEKEMNNENISKVDKYPHNWHTTWRRSKKNYNQYIRSIDEEKFAENTGKFKHLEFEDRRYSIVVPDRSSEIKKEASGLKHCVASYIPRVISGDTLIVFCRERVDTDEPLVTIEVRRGYVTQAYGYEDSKPDDEVLNFIRKWAKKNELKLSWRWD